MELFIEADLRVKKTNKNASKGCGKWQISGGLHASHHFPPEGSTTPPPFQKACSLLKLTGRSECKQLEAASIRGSVRKCVQGAL